MIWRSFYVVDFGTFVWALGWLGFGVRNEVWLNSLVFGSSCSFFWDRLSWCVVEV